MQQNIHALIRYGERSGYVAECTEIAVVTQGETLDQVVSNLQGELDVGTCRAIMRQASVYILISELKPYFYE